MKSEARLVPITIKVSQVNGATKITDISPPDAPANAGEYVSWTVQGDLHGDTVKIHFPGKGPFSRRDFTIPPWPGAPPTDGDTVNNNEPKGNHPYKTTPPWTHKKKDRADVDPEVQVAGGSGKHGHKKR